MEKRTPDKTIQKTNRIEALRIASSNGKAMKYWIVSTMLALTCGCSANRMTAGSRKPDPSPNVLVEQLRARGAEPSSTSKLVFKGSEADVGWDTQVAITDREVIDAVWQSIANATGYGKPAACGWRTIEFYSGLNSNTAVAGLRVYCGGFNKDSVHIEGIDPWKSGRAELYACEGLNELVMKHLQEEYERRRKDAIP